MVKTDLGKNVLKFHGVKTLKRGELNDTARCIICPKWARIAHQKNIKMIHIFNSFCPIVNNCKNDVLGGECVIFDDIKLPEIHPYLHYNT